MFDLHLDLVQSRVLALLLRVEVGVHLLTSLKRDLLDRFFLRICISAVFQNVHRFGLVVADFGGDRGFVF